MTLTRRISTDAALRPMFRTLTTLSGEMENSAHAHAFLELIRMRVSQINGCAPCLGYHSKELLDAGERVERIVTLDAWREAEWFTEEEQAALAWAEAVTRREHNEVPQAAFDQVREHFSEAEVIDLTVAVVAINAVNMYNLAFSGKPVGHAEQDEVKARVAV